MITVEQATQIVRDKSPNDLIVAYFEYRDEYRFVTSFKPFSVYGLGGLSVVNKNTGAIHFESIGQIYDKFYPLGEEGMKLAKEYKQAEGNLHNVDLSDEEWKEFQDWLRIIRM